MISKLVIALTALVHNTSLTKFCLLLSANQTWKMPGTGSSSTMDHHPIQRTSGSTDGPHSTSTCRTSNDPTRNYSRPFSTSAEPPSLPTIPGSPTYLPSERTHPSRQSSRHFDTGRSRDTSNDDNQASRGHIIGEEAESLQTTKRPLGQRVMDGILSCINNRYSDPDAGITYVAQGSHAQSHDLLPRSEGYGSRIQHPAPLGTSTDRMRKRR